MADGFSDLFDLFFEEGVNAGPDDGANTGGTSDDGSFDSACRGYLSAMNGPFAKDDLAATVEIGVDDFGINQGVAADPYVDIREVFSA